MAHDSVPEEVPLAETVEQTTLQDVKGSVEQELDELDDETEEVILETDPDCVSDGLIVVAVAQSDGFTAEIGGVTPSTGGAGGGGGPTVQSAAEQTVLGTTRDGGGTGGKIGGGGGNGKPNRPLQVLHLVNKLRMQLMARSAMSTRFPQESLHKGPTHCHFQYGIITTPPSI